MIVTLIIFLLPAGVVIVIILLICFLASELREARGLERKHRYQNAHVSGYQPVSEPAGHSPPQGGSVIAKPTRMNTIEHNQSGLTAQQAADVLTMAFAHARPSIYDFIPGYQPKDEPFPPERGAIEQMECEVDYEVV